MVISRNLPLASQVFTKITSLSLPALFPASEMLGVLKQLHKCLKSNGRLHLTLLNPSPNACSLGPKLREWLDENLLLNLEKSFRCTHPTRLFPDWLADAHLRADGSTITTVKYLAATIQDQIGPLGMSNIADSEGSIRSQLRSLMGRHIWREIWGQFIHAKIWWWEDEGIVEECFEMGTYWDLQIIQAVKK